MKYLPQLIIASLIWVPYQRAQFSLAIEYQLNEKSRNPWGDLNITADYSTQISFQKNKPVTVSIGTQYENKPGLIGNLGHIRLVMDARHPNQEAQHLLAPFVNEANTVFNYNPCIISKYKEESNSYKASTEKLREEIEYKTKSLRENNLEKFRFLKDKECFMEQKKLFESFSYDEKNPNTPIIKAIIEELEKKYKELEKKYE